MPALIMALLAAAAAFAAAMARMGRQRRLRAEGTSRYLDVARQGEALVKDLDELLPFAEVVAWLPPLPGSRPWAAGDEVLILKQQAGEGLDRLATVRSALAQGRWAEASRLMDLVQGMFQEAQTTLHILQERLGAMDNLWALPATAAVLLQKARVRTGRPEAHPRAEEAVAEAESAMAAHVTLSPAERASGSRRLALALGLRDLALTARARQPRIVDLVRTEAPILLERLEDAGAMQVGNAAERLGALRRELVDAVSALDDHRLEDAEVLARQVRDRGHRLLAELEAGILAAPETGAAKSRTLIIQALVPAFLVGLIASAMTTRIGHMLPVRGPADRRPLNVAQGAPTRATSELTEDLGAANLTDGRLETAWVARQTLLDSPVAVIGLPKPVPLASISVLPLAVPPSACTWEIDVSTDHRRWVTVGRTTGAGAPRPEEAAWGTVTPEGSASWQFIRIRPLDWGRSGVGVFEIRAWTR
ncbi:MAG: discoidin domain-containing protein [Candidatus Sericytochromatia bacterium]|nr:discoidin domain-containing protein [Candidatus Sericytochromatia bacterium]